MATWSAISRERRKTMKVKCFGTRGSVPVANAQTVKYGGNTTCLNIESECLPPDYRLVVDAGTGIVPLGNIIASNGRVGRVVILFTHYHFDHTEGLKMSAILRSKQIRIQCFGPLENGIGPQEMLKDLMKPPYFPLDYVEVASRVSAKSIEYPAGTVILIHPRGGLRMLGLDGLVNTEGKKPPQINVGKGRYDLNECLVVRMYKANHPERTISYKVEEKPTGKTFVVLTDHENQDGIPQALISHLAKTDCLLIDCQYDRKTYDEQTAGFGHATPDFCVRLAHKVEAKKVGLTHHSPFSSDDKIDEILGAAQSSAKDLGFKGEIFACSDYQEITV